MKFLEELAHILFNDHGKDLSKVAVVLPNRRAGVYLRAHLARMAGGALWSPDIHTMETFLSKATGIRTIPVEVALIDMFRAHTGLAGENAGSFADMLQWGPTALRDMNEVDHHLLDHEVLYRDLRHLEEIDTWSLHGTELSQGQLRSIGHWEHHGRLHSALTNTLDAGRGTIPGAVARWAATHASEWIEKMPWSSVVFAGANSLTPAELGVVKELVAVDRSWIAWDVDAYYIDDPLQSSARTLKPLMNELGPGRIPVQDRIAHSVPQIGTVAVPDRISEVDHTAAEIDALSLEERANTCIVLADQTLLLPLLHALPVAVGPVNVTMGISMDSLPIADLIDALLQMLNAHHPVRGHLKKDVVRLLGHPFWPADPRINTLIERTHRSRSERIRFETIFPPDNDRTMDPMIASLCEAMRPVPLGSTPGEALIALIVACKAVPQERFLMEQLYQCAKVVERTEELLARTGAAVDGIGYREVLSRIFRQAKATFFGEPLEGLQIMGLLESRATDHDRVIILGANEGSLPPEVNDQSFIPFDVRRAYALPLRDQQDAVLAYPFQRLLHHCQHLQMVYVDNGQGELAPSRFIAQVRYELMPRTGGSVTHRSLRPTVPERPAVPIEIHKTQAILEQLHARAERGFSPTALETYLRCPLDLYMGHVLGIQSSESRTSALGHDELGQATHSALETIYAPFVGKLIDTDILTHSVDGVGEILRAQATNLLGHSPSGPALLQLTMAEKAIQRFIRSEISTQQRHGPFHLLAAELALNSVLRERPIVRVRGRLDRVDMRNGVVHIIDMKTGKVDAIDLKLASLDRAELTKKKGKALQMLMYAWAYFSEHPEVDVLKAMIIPLRQSTNNEGLFLQLAGEDLITRSMLPEISACLMELIDEILDPTLPFVHSPESSYCRACIGTP